MHSAVQEMEQKLSSVLTHKVAAPLLYCFSCATFSIFFVLLSVVCKMHFALLQVLFMSNILPKVKFLLFLSIEIILKILFIYFLQRQLFSLVLCSLTKHTFFKLSIYRISELCHAGDRMRSASNTIHACFKSF